MASDSNWLRTYSLKAGQAGQTGFEIGTIDSPTETALHICFSIEKSDSAASNTAKVQIWNLSPENLAILEQPDCIVELKAGYQNNNALVLAGTVSDVVSELDNADRMTELEVIDGLVEVRDTAVSISLNGTVDAKTLYDTVSTETGMAIVYAPDLVYPTFPNGFSYVGTANEALAKIAASCGHSYTIQNSIILVTNPGMPISTYGYLLSSETGLISIPRRISITASDSTESTQTGYEVVYFLNGNIGINDIVYIQSNDISGYFRVHKVTIDGDNIDGDWTCTAQVLEIAGEDSTYTAS